MEILEIETVEIEECLYREIMNIEALDKPKKEKSISYEMIGLTKIYQLLHFLCQHWLSKVPVFTMLVLPSLANKQTSLNRKKNGQKKKNTTT